MRTEGREGRIALACCCVCALMMSAISRSYAGVILEMRPAFQSIMVGETVNVELYAVWDGEPRRSVAAVDAIIAWNPSHLQMLSLTNVGATSLLFSGFPVNDPFNLNEVVPPQDGDGLYQALANFGSPVITTQAGVLLTTLRLTALAQSPQSPVDFLVSGGSPLGYTRVYDGSVPNLDITSGLSGATIAIVPEPGAILPVLLFAWLVQGGFRRRQRVRSVNRTTPNAMP